LASQVNDLGVTAEILRFAQDDSNERSHKGRPGNRRGKTDFLEPTLVCRRIAHWGDCGCEKVLMWCGRPDRANWLSQRCV
jgi:hypothetical protein